MKQRLGIANGLDPIGISELRNFLKILSKDYGKTILISSHILSEIDLLADDIGILDHGVLLEECSMETLKEKTDKLEHYFKMITGGKGIA